MQKGSRFAEKMKNYLLFGGISKEEYDQVHPSVAAANHKSLTYWSVLVSFFWIYCLVMSLNAEDYKMCRPAYAAALGVCIFTFLCSRFVLPKFPDTIFLFKFIFRFSLLAGGVGIAVCQWNLRSLTMFAVAIISPSIFIDSTMSSILVHTAALILYIVLGRNTIAPEIYSWGLGNYILFSVFGFLIGNAINKERFERYVFAESEKKLVEEGKKIIDKVTADGTFAVVYNPFGCVDWRKSDDPKRNKPLRTPLWVATSKDGIRWTPTRQLETSPIGQYSYPTMIVGSDGTLHCVYTWRRERIKYKRIIASPPALSHREGAGARKE